MSNYDLVIDISSDEEERDNGVRQSTPIKVLSLNVITTLDLSGSSLEATKGSTEEMMSSVNDLNLSDISASTFETIGTPKKITFSTASPGEEFIVENQVQFRPTKVISKSRTLPVSCPQYSMHLFYDT